MEEMEYRVKAAGEAQFVPDGGTQGHLEGRFLRSRHAHAQFAVRLPILPVGYYIVDHRDVQGENGVELMGDPEPVFPVDRVEYIGQPILLVAGPDGREVERILSQIQVEYTPLNAVSDLEAAQESFMECSFEKGEPDDAFDGADEVFDESFSAPCDGLTAWEPVYLAARWDSGRLLLQGAGDCPGWVVEAVSRATGLPDEQIETVPMAGGWSDGGYPPGLACRVAVAARKTGGQTVLVSGDALAETGRAVRSRCRVAVKNGRVFAVEMTVTLDAGCRAALSPLALRRGMLSACGGYFFPHLRVLGRAVKTNRPPVEDIRGLGAPQAEFALEMMMCHIAQEFGMDSLAFKERHLAHEEDDTPTGGTYTGLIPLSMMVRELDKDCGYRDKHMAYREEQTGRVRRGAGLALGMSGGEAMPTGRELPAITEESFQGDVFSGYGWSVVAVEVEVDCVTGDSRVVDVHGLYDVRHWGDAQGVRGQLEGELLLALRRAKGLKGLPTSLDVPSLKTGFYTGGASNAGNLGEVSAAAGLAAYAAAVEQAVGGQVRHVPFGAGDVLRKLREVAKAKAEEEAQRI